MTGLIKKNDSVISILASLGVLTAGTVALITYLNKKEIVKLQKKNAELEHEIKQLEIIKLKHDLDGMD